MQWQNSTFVIMLRNLTLNSVVWIILGVGFFLSGIFFLYKWRTFGFTLLGMPIGLIFVGTGMMFCGLTNGFTDHSVLGRKLKRIGAFLLITGIPPIGYVFYYYFY